ncbi:MAG: hypothetical protein H7138_17120 [Myxococcales bacterium]|nr:hypothetical protein [Myxococcales bacterium]
MKRLTILTSVLALAAGCGDDGGNTPPIDGPVAPPIDGPVTPPIDGPVVGQTITLDADITTNTTLLAVNTYVIPTMKQLFVKSGATLTIEPGTVIKGDRGSVLVITRGSKINANGTAAKPIVLTTTQAAGQKTPGWWGGLLVLGAARINVNERATPKSEEATFEAFAPGTAEGKFGGTNDADDSGIIKYVRIEFAGFNFVADREFNNFTLCGVGSGTTVDYVQLHGGTDDGIELFGGTVNVKHIVSSQNQDDGFDMDNGWNGNAQFVIVQNISHPATLPEATNGYESDNHAAAASYTAEPRTLPTMSNVTLIGDRDFAGGAHFAAVFRRGTAGRFVNHIWYNFQKGPEIRDADTAAQITAGNLSVTYSMLFNNDASATNLPPPQGTGDIDEALLFNAANNVKFAVDPGLPAAATSKTAPSFVPAAGAAALTSGTTPPANAFFDATATFAGAIGTVDWTAGWTAYPQN